jgi:hypothetical protein
LVDIKSLNLGCGVIVDPQGDESLLRMLIAARWPVLTTGRVVNLDHQADVLSIDNDVVAVTKSALGGANEIVIRHLTRQTAPRYRSCDRAVNRHSRCLWRRCHSDLDHVSGRWIFTSVGANGEDAPADETRVNDRKQRDCLRRVDALPPRAGTPVPTALDSVRRRLDSELRDVFRTGWWADGIGVVARVEHTLHSPGHLSQGTGMS